ncbi:uncharacterized protein METZ01_LOCUS43468 [marine metagenome]|uniref:Uncharacterized protein n=1 Tax=marine metagenome TaxID=408172 RepID=A0A381RH84_9ZZZZ
MAAVRLADGELRWSPDNSLRLFRPTTKFVESSLPNHVYCGSGRPTRPDSAAASTVDLPVSSGLSS